MYKNYVPIYLLNEASTIINLHVKQATDWLPMRFL